MAIIFLDTSFLLDCPDCLDEIPTSTDEYVVPFVVLDELDKLRKAKGHIGAVARYVVRRIVDLALAGHIRTVGYRIEADISNDDAIILAATETASMNQEEETAVATSDIGLAAKAWSAGLSVRLALDDVDTVSDFVHNPFFEAAVTSEEIERLYSNGAVAVEIETNYNGIYGLLTDGKSSAPVWWKNGIARKLREPRNGCAVRPVNLEQRFLADALLADDIDLISVTGAAGTGKTFLTVGIVSWMVAHGRYNKIVYTKPAVHVGHKDRIGYLPGDLQSKMEQHTLALRDTAAKLFGSETPAFVEVAYIGFMRGRNLDDAIIILDEAQNASTLELKTLLTRAGENTKVILLGDTNQSDVFTGNTDFEYVIEQFADWERAAHIHLKKVLRSGLAKEAAERL